MLYAKHLLLMTLALTLVPLVARWLAAWNGSSHRMIRPSATLRWIVAQILTACLVTFLAEGTYELLSAQWNGWVFVRFVALGFAGMVYGLLFGDADDFPKIPAALCGAIAGCAAAFLFGALAPTDVHRSLCVAVFAVGPLCAYAPIVMSVRDRVDMVGEIIPSRRLLH